MFKPLKKDILNKLIDKAINASNNAFHPITPKGVGAAVLTTEDEIFQGCNVQTTISGLGVCAEQCAIYHAVANGKYDFKAVAVYFPSEKFIKPCGMCLQLITEFSQVINKDIIIVMINKDKKIKFTSVNKELKDAYGPRVSGRNLSAYAHNHNDVNKISNK
jgi:cytidine deaminase